MAIPSSSSGVVFCPDKYESIAILMSKLFVYHLPCDDIREDLNPYDESQLPNIFKDAQTKDLYFFFNKLSRKGKSGSKNVKRTAGKGTWHGEQISDVKYNDEGVVEIIGTQHTFKYKEEDSENDNGYLMTEYRLVENTWLEYDPVKHGVFCVLRHNDLQKKKRRSCHVNNDNEASVAAKRVCSSSSDEEAALHQTTIVTPSPAAAVAIPVSFCSAGDPQNPAMTYQTTWGEGNVQQMKEFQVAASLSDSPAAAGGYDMQLSLLEGHLMKDYVDDNHNNNFMVSSELVEIAAANPVSCWTDGSETPIPALTDPSAWGDGDIQQMMMSGEEFQIAAAASPSSDGCSDNKLSVLERMQQFDKL